MHSLFMEPNNIIISRYSAFAKEKIAPRNCATILLHALMKVKDGDMFVIRGCGDGCDFISLLL